MRVGDEVDLQATGRFVHHVRVHAITDVFDALVELITNADDSYGRQFQTGQRNQDGGEIRIWHHERRSGRSSIAVGDRAEGMNVEAMKRGLMKLGARSSKHGDRGYLGRGAKDCAALGDLRVESISDGNYFRCVVTYAGTFRLEAAEQRPTRDQRRRMGIPRGSGTLATLLLNDVVKLPRFERLAAELPWHFALRRLASAASASTLVLSRAKGERKRLLYQPPPAELVEELQYAISAYPQASAALRLWRSSEPLGDGGGDRFRRFGVLVSGGRATHEVAVLAEELRHDPLAQRYYGELVCEHIDDLLEDYELRRERGGPPSEANPKLVIDPSRRGGLERRHPFASALLGPAAGRLRALVAQDRQLQEQSESRIEDQQLERRLRRLAKLASRFLKDHASDAGAADEQDSADRELFAVHGIALFPTYSQIEVGETKTVTLHVRSDLSAPGRAATFGCDAPESLDIPEGPVALAPHPERQDILRAVATVTGLRPHDNVLLRAEIEGLQAVGEALITVRVAGPQDREFSGPLEFERERYRVRYGRQRRIRLFAEAPGLVSLDVDPLVTSSAPGSVEVALVTSLQWQAGTNFAVGDVVVGGLRLQDEVAVTAEVGHASATTVVRVIDEPDSDRGVPIRIELRRRRFGQRRAMWAVNEGHPNLLLVSALHDSLARYLGGPPDYPGQSSPLFRLLLAEIVAESVSRRSLVLEAKERPWDFDFEGDDPDVVADAVLSHLSRRMSAFLGEAHKVMLSASELRSLSRRP